MQAGSAIGGSNNNRAAKRAEPVASAAAGIGQPNSACGMSGQEAPDEGETAVNICVMWIKIKRCMAAVTSAIQRDVPEGSRWGHVEPCM